MKTFFPLLREKKKVCGKGKKLIKFSLSPHHLAKKLEKQYEIFCSRGKIINLVQNTLHTPEVTGGQLNLLCDWFVNAL